LCTIASARLPHVWIFEGNNRALIQTTGTGKEIVSA
jgi:hypothetical protein